MPSATREQRRCGEPGRGSRRLPQRKDVPRALPRADGPKPPRSTGRERWRKPAKPDHRVRGGCRSLSAWSPAQRGVRRAADTPPTTRSHCLSGPRWGTVVDRHSPASNCVLCYFSAFRAGRSETETPADHDPGARGRGVHVARRSEPGRRAGCADAPRVDDGASSADRADVAVESPPARWPHCTRLTLDSARR